MLRKIIPIVLLVAALTAAPTAAFAVDYVPKTPPTVPTLAGSAVNGVCNGDVPYINYSLSLTDPDNQSTSHSAFLVLSDGSNSVSIPLGQIVNGQLSGSVLWPGASVAADGSPAGWPGWMKLGDNWVQTDGNFGWTRGITSAQITVNPTLSVPLSYPPASPSCVTSPPSSSPAALASTPVDNNPLAATGVSSMLLPIGLGALALVALGAVIMVVRRKAAGAAPTDPTNTP